MIGKIVVGVLGGFVVTGLAVLPIGVIRSDAQVILIGLLVFWVLALALAITAEQAVEAWRRLLVVSAVLCFSLPFLSVIFAGARNMKAVLVSDTLTLADAAIIGFFLGTIFLIIGLRVGRDKQVLAEDRRHGFGRRTVDRWDEMQASLVWDRWGDEDRKSDD